MLALFRYVRGDDYNDVFELKMESKSVSAPKNAIKEQQSPEFDERALVSDTLVLLFSGPQCWPVSARWQWS